MKVIMTCPNCKASIQLSGMDYYLACITVMCTRCGEPLITK